MNTTIKLLALINPISGTGKQKGIESLLKQHINSSRFELHIKYTQYAGHGSELAKEAIRKNFNAVLAVGGDGTINEIARSLVFSDTALAIIPCGSGNGLARHLKIPMNQLKATRWLNQAKIMKMDTITVNEHLFVNVAGIGFDALVAHQFAKMNSRGLVSYTKAVIQSFRTFKSQTFRIKNDQLEILEEGMLISFANSSQYGNNAYIAPNARIDDGKLNLSILRKPKWFQVPGLAYKVFTKRINSSSLFTEIIVDEANIYQESNLGHVDGEAVTFGKELNLKLAPRSLRVFV